jgi:phage gpG-like protein
MSNFEENDTIELKGLDQILKALKAKPPVCRVGILGGSNSRNTMGVGNATIGAAHEFGTSKMPQRSFLRVPLTDNLNKELEKSNAFNADVLKEVIKSGSVKEWLELVKDTAVKIVVGAFGTNGYGKWAAWKNPSYTNNTGQILLDTQQLRNSITGEVK